MLKTPHMWYFVGRTGPLMMALLRPIRSLKTGSTFSSRGLKMIPTVVWQCTVWQVWEGRLSFKWNGDFDVFFFKSGSFKYLDWGYRYQTRTTCARHHFAFASFRAPVLVALALIELGMKYEDAVEYIREYVNLSSSWLILLVDVFYDRFLLLSRKRRGAINAKQLAYLEKYRPKSRLKIKNGHRQCIIQWWHPVAHAFTLNQVLWVGLNQLRVSLSYWRHY